MPDTPALGRFQGLTTRPGVRRPRVAAGAFALVTAALPFLARLAINARAPVPVNLAPMLPTLATLGLVGPAIAAGALAVTTEDDTERVGLVVLGVFGVLVAVVPSAVVPSAAALVCGGTLTVAGRFGAHDRARWRAIPAAAVLCGVALSLSGAMGVATATTRPAGAHLALLGAAGTPALLGHGYRDWALGGLLGGLLVAVGAAAPFLTGAVALVGGGIVATGLLVMAAGLCGLVTTLSAAVRTRHLPAALGAGLLLVAGVPATFPRAIAAVVGLLMLLEPRGASA